MRYAGSDYNCRPAWSAVPLDVAGERGFSTRVPAAWTHGLWSLRRTFPERFARAGTALRCDNPDDRNHTMSFEATARMSVAPCSPSSASTRSPPTAMRLAQGPGKPRRRRQRVRVAEGGAHDLDDLRRVGGREEVRAWAVRRVPARSSVQVAYLGMELREVAAPVGEGSPALGCLHVLSAGLRDSYLPDGRISALARSGSVVLDVVQQTFRVAELCHARVSAGV